jgi:hypothetical protein
MSDPKVLQLIERLHEKTMAGTLEWEKTVEDGEFQVSFPNYSVQLKQHPDEPMYLLTLLNDVGEIIAEVNDEDYDGPGASEGLKPVYRKMKAMYERARRDVLGVDKAVDSILIELDDELPF